MAEGPRPRAVACFFRRLYLCTKRSGVTPLELVDAVMQRVRAIDAAHLQADALGGEGRLRPAGGAGGGTELRTVGRWIRNGQQVDQMHAAWCLAQAPCVSVAVE